MKKQVLVILTASVLTLMSACNKGGSKAQAPAPPVNEEKNCIHEADLLKAGIVGGVRVADIDEDSKKVIMVYGTNADGGNFICTAAAIAPNVLLTAAHCIGAKHAAVFHSAISCESGFSIERHMKPATTAFKHDKYKSSNPNMSNSEYDIGIIILEKNIPNSYKVLKIADPTKVDFNNGELKFIGYGNVDFQAGGAGILRKTTLPMTSVMTNYTEKVIQIDQSSGHGVCSGDSGGPSIVVVNGEEQILGVNSIVYGAAQDEKELACDKMTAQAQAFSHIDWIETELAKRGLKIKLNK